MKKLNQISFPLVSFAIAVFLFAGCNPQPKDITDEIVKANMKFMTAFDSGDAAALADCYTSDAKLFPSNSDVILGNENIQKTFQSFMDMGITKAVLKTLYAESYGNIANEEGAYILYAGDKIIDKGKYIVVWKKVNGEWKLYRDIFNTNNPAPPVRAAVSDTVWIIENKIKPNKVADFEEFNFSILEPATVEFYPKMHNTVRTLKPVEPNKDGSFTYIYLMDPANNPDGYDMMLPLTAKYGEEKAEEYLNEFQKYLVNGKQNWVKTIQTKW